jgi:flagellar motility protein MotE (MotC chaperone)
MNVEKTIEFILSTQADTAVQLADLTKKQARTDRQIHGLQVLVKTGMKMLAKTQQSVKALAAEQKRTEQVVRNLATSMEELAVAQKRTDKRFERWLERGSNGGGKRRA